MSQWTPYGKVRTVTKTAENLTINYRYDAAGNRVAKITDKEGNVTTNRYIRDASGNVMAVYKDSITLEHHVYGSSRLGLAVGKSKTGQLKLGYRNYELSNHLGNVLAVITDNVNIVSDEAESEWYSSKAWPNLMATNDYYPFGLGMEGRTSNLGDSTAYRYGFNGKEKDPEGMGGGGSTYDYGFRIYNPRIAKFLSVDPLTKTYPMLTPYQFASNRPIDGIDLDGLEYITYRHYMAKDGKTQIKIEKDEYFNKQKPIFHYSVSFGSEGRGVKHEYYNSDGHLYNIDWDQKQGGLFSLSAITQHGFYSGGFKIGSISDGFGENADVQPIDWADAIAKRHDFDYIRSKNENPYTGGGVRWLEDVNTLSADKAMVDRLNSLTFWQKDGFDEINSIEGIEKPYYKGYSAEMSNALDGQKIVISTLRDYKQWKVDKGYGNNKTFGDISNELKEENYSLYTMVNLINSNSGQND